MGGREHTHTHTLLPSRVDDRWGNYLKQCFPLSFICDRTHPQSRTLFIWILSTQPVRIIRVLWKHYGANAEAMNERVKKARRKKRKALTRSNERLPFIIYEQRIKKKKKTGSCNHFTLIMRRPGPKAHFWFLIHHYAATGIRLACPSSGISKAAWTVIAQAYVNELWPQASDTDIYVCVKDFRVVIKGQGGSISEASVAAESTSVSNQNEAGSGGEGGRGLTFWLRRRHTWIWCCHLVPLVWFAAVASDERWKGVRECYFGK